MAKYDRLFHILNLLRSRRSLSARKLAEECQVTERSIYRDLISLSEANIPVYYDKGYKLASGNFLPTLNFTAEEYACLRLTLESSPLARAGRKADTIRRIKAKIDCSLPETTRQKNRAAVTTSHIAIDSTVIGRAAARFYGLLEQAASDQTTVELEYESIDHGLARRLVDPYFIVFRRHAFYFVAFCHLRNDFRTFRIDRVKKLTSTAQHFVRNRDVSADTYFEGSWGLYRGAPVEVVIDFRGRSARVVAGSRHHDNESAEKIGPDHLRYRVTVKGTEEVKRWILGFGGEAEVLAPPLLRTELQAVAQRLNGIYRARGTRKNDQS